MRTVFLLLSFIPVVCVSFYSLVFGADLSQADLDRLTKREFIVQSRDIPMHPWPEITIFGLIDATPLEAAALFSNYQDQKKYIPDLIKSEPRRKTAENEVIVDFEMQTPWPLSNSRYSTANVFKITACNEYEIRWRLVESDSLIDSKGTARFIPYGNKTLFIYKSLIHPNSRFASMFSSKAKAGLFKTVQAIVTYIEQTKKNDPEKIHKLIDSLPR
ncbi:MAG TPA: hypothetical protein VGJ94_02025 [Syntrophorhabdaceae bacterium]